MKAATMKEEWTKVLLSIHHSSFRLHPCFSALRSQQFLFLKDNLLVPPLDYRSRRFPLSESCRHQGKSFDRLCKFSDRQGNVSCL